MKTRERTLWNGQWNGVNWEVNRTPAEKINVAGFQEHWPIRWTFYLYLHIDRIPDDAESYWLKLEDRKYLHYDYNNHHVLSSIDWHGGITYYSKESGFDDTPRVIQVGCDYQHYWDEGKSYDLEDIQHDIRTAIISFRKMVPGYKFWCRTDGKLHAPEEVTLDDAGDYKCECRLERAVEVGK